LLSNRTGENVLLIAAGKLYGLFLRRASEQSGFKDWATQTNPDASGNCIINVPYSSTSMIAFGSSGNIKWSVPNDSPQIATADGGVIGSSGVTYDSQGRATGQIANLPIQSWTGNSYHGVF
jgi:hypothetical protein